jgi:hypothetical protein
VRPAAAVASGASSSGSILGVHVPPEVKQGAMLAILTLLGGALLVALLIADQAGLGPRHGAWRARWSYRFKY